MTEKIRASDVEAFLDILGLDELPMGMYYSDGEPEEGIAPKSGLLPTIEMEARGEVDWGALLGNFSCVIGNIWRARKKKPQPTSTRSGSVVWAVPSTWVF